MSSACVRGGINCRLMPVPTKVTDLDHLRKLVEDGHHEFHIRLNGGLISRKFIWLAADEKRFKIENGIDGSTQTLTDIGIMNMKFSNIGPAIELGAFYCED